MQERASCPKAKVVGLMQDQAASNVAVVTIHACAQQRGCKVTQHMHNDWP